MLGMSSLPERTDIPERYRWNAESVFADRRAWRAELAAAGAALPALKAFAGRLAESPELLADFLQGADELVRRVGTLHFFATMSQAVDSGDAEATAMVGQADSLFGAAEAALAFRDPELLAIGRDRLDAWLAAEPRLAIYRHQLDDLFRQQAHVRSAEVEELLGLAGEVFASAENIHDMLVDADLIFPPVRLPDGSSLPIAQSTVEKHLASPDREVRRQAWQNYCDSHRQFGNTLAASLCTAVRRDNFLAKARRFDDSLQAALFAHNIPAAVYRNTIDTFQAKIAVWHRYWRVRRRALGVDRLRHWDIWAPIAARQPVVPYEQAVDWICQALSPLGAEYAADLRRGCLEQRWIDVYPSRGKGSGAFSYGWRGTHPFIMMSYADDLSSLSTLTHELGHSMHSLHTWRAQPAPNADYSIFVAEVASNFHQALTRAWLFEHQTDRDFQIALIEEAMENFHRYFFIMPTLARFELELHRRLEAGEGVTAGDLDELAADLFAEGYGGELELDRPREGCTWAQFSHLYMNYYVFQYATGISAAHALAAPILAGDTAAARRYVEFLSAGSSLYPVDALKRAGVDMTTPAAMEQAFAVLEKLVDRLEALCQ